MTLSIALYKWMINNVNNNHLKTKPGFKSKKSLSLLKSRGIRLLLRDKRSDVDMQDVVGYLCY